ncbi:TPA: hypothetical protein EYG96_00215 [Candidatus Gracilibacteria bacterium]|nr:hypothetical protein [Candidatus Peregrinibacteria bacterium]HIQ56452.1 hypothetical protein [Candidatus Gracilibacteria bacterium]HIQ57282.1 hypothetical protein [Candidatus Gracilibacteria bacterium]
MNFVYGIMGIALGFSIIKYRYGLYEMMGTWSFAERLFGSGGTVTAMILMGLMVIIFSIMLMFGQLDNSLSGASKYVTGGE